jgi:rRNA-processing protein FCF1
MSTATKTLAKSLHTITALAQVARLIAEHTGKPAQSCVGEAARALGYVRGTADPYGLQDKARAILASD